MNAAWNLTKKVLHRQGWKQNTVFSPYGVQQGLDILKKNTTDAAMIQDLSPYSVSVQEQLQNTRSGALSLLLSKKPMPGNWNDAGVQCFTNPQEATICKNDFQQRILDEILDAKELSHTDDDGLNLFIGTKFEAKWLKPFDKGNTRKQPFYLTPQTEITVETMSDTFDAIPMVQTDAYEGVALPGEKGATVYFIKPKRQDCDDVLNRLPNIMEAMKPGQVKFYMPKLRTNTKTDLLDLLKGFHSLNLPWEENHRAQARGMQPCDGIFFLDRLSAQIPFILRKAYQIATLDVNEERAVAKALTRIYLTAGSVVCAIVPPAVIRMDSPYFVVIKDLTADHQERIVFTAWIADPRA